MTKTYADRDAVLLEIGFSSYQEYLKSELWDYIKELCRAEHGSKCRLCDRPSDVFHHLTYEDNVLRGLDLSEIVPLCHGCHKKVEVKRDGKKRPLIEAQCIFKSILSAKQKKLRRMELSEWCVLCGNKAIKKLNICGPCLKLAKKNDPPLAPPMPNEKRGNQFRCADCQAITHYTVSEALSASRIRCMACGSSKLDRVFTKKKFSRGRSNPPKGLYYKKRTLARRRKQ